MTTAEPVLEEDLPVLVTTGEAALLAHVEPVTIRQWVHRGRLAPRGRTSAGHLLFDVAAVFAATRA